MVEPKAFQDALLAYHARPCDPEAEAVRAAVRQWQPIETAPKSPANGKHVQGIYLLGFCPDPDTCNLDSAICVIWWEPLMNRGNGMWYGEGGYEVKPTHWQPLPPPPGVPASAPVDKSPEARRSGVDRTDVPRKDGNGGRVDALPRCPHVPGAACPGAECQAKGCVRTHGVNGGDDAQHA